MTAWASFVEQAWADHGTAPDAVAHRLPQALALVSDEAALSALARLAHHVLGEHLGAWGEAHAFLRRLQQHAACRPAGDSGSLLRRLAASLSLAEGDAGPRNALPRGEAVAATALAAAQLLPHDSARAAQLWHEALQRAEAQPLPAGDPALRALAVAGNNLAAALIERPERNEAERQLMVDAATAGRRYWQRAGGWLEVERADYRLALAWLAAGEVALARAAAAACLARVLAQPEPPALERFYAHEAGARVALAMKDAGALAMHQRAATAAWTELNAQTRQACAADQAALAALRLL